MRSRVLWRHLEGIWWNDDSGAEDYKKNDYHLSFTFRYKEDNRNEPSCVWRCGPHYYFCASDAPVSRSCKTYPVTQTKQNNWTGEASLRPGKSNMRSRVLWRHLEGIWRNDDIGAEDYKKNDCNLSFTFRYKKDNRNEQSCVWRCGPHYLRCFWCPGKQKL